MNMKRFALLIMLAGALLAGCNNVTDQPLATQLPPAPTAEAQSPAPTEAEALPTDLPAEPTSTSPALATAEPSPTAEPPTEAPTATEPPTEAPSPEASPTAEASPTTEPTAVSLFAPGQQDGGSLAAGGAQAYLVQGRAFQPLILFVEPTNELNVALAAYVGDQTGQTTPEGVTPPAAADNALAGRPEILVLSPESDGLYTLVVRAAAGEGSFAAHLYDLTTPAPGAAVQQPDTLSAGEEKTYEVTSNGARPVIVAVDPSDQSDVALDILGADGAVITTANFGGPGGVETAYVLPLGATTYTVKVREANSGASAFQVLAVTLE